MWRIELLGGLTATRDDRCVSRFRTRKTASLLAYLAYYGRLAHPREALIELFWPGSRLEAGRNQLRMALTSLRRQLEPPGTPAGAVIVSDRFKVQISPAACTTDVAQFENALRNVCQAGSDTEKGRRLVEAVDLYRAELLPGFFEDWVLGERLRLAEAYLQALDHLVALAEQAGDLAGAIEWAQRAVRADPYREEAQHALIRVLAVSEQTGAALRQYREWERLLATDCGAAPAEEIRSLAFELERHAGQRAAAREHPRRTSVSLPRPTVSLPFPAGTVTFLIYQIEGDPGAPGIDKPAFQSAWEECRGLLEQLFRGSGGHEVRKTGEMLQVAFGRVTDALAAAVAGLQSLAMQPWPAAFGTPRVRTALHTGEIDPGEEIEHSVALSHTARLLWAAHSGQMLLSEKSAGMLGNALPAHVRLRDLGCYRLGEGATTERLFQVDIPEVTPRELPPPNALPGLEPRLPLRMTRFFGREPELIGLRKLLSRADVRLLTLTGPGGGGKSRLAIEAASQLQKAFHGAIWFVPLADLVDPNQIASKILDVLRLPRSPELDPVEQLAAALSRQPCLLLLDNFEHLLSDGAELVNTLLERAPMVTMLVTSRRRLGLTGEREFPLPLLPFPSQPDAPERLLEYESVQLFVDRAQMALPDFQITPTNAAAIASLCRQLEGLPLALELAAARVQALTPAQILARLSGRFEQLTTRKRDVFPRHRSLWLALDWSYQLLSPELQRFFTRLSVFRGGWTLPAAEAVCEEPLSLEYLTQLRENSLVMAEESGEEMRFRLLEPLREYGAEQLDPAARAALERRHALHFLTLAEAAEPHLRGTDQEVWMARLQRDYDNLRAALTWGLAQRAAGSAPDDGEGVEAASRSSVGARLAGALWWFWHFRCYWSEGRAWLNQALARIGERLPEGAEPELRRTQARVLLSAGQLAMHQGDLAIAETRLEESRAIWQKLADKQGLAYSTMFLGAVVGHHDRPRSYSLAQESVDAFRELDDPWARGQSLYFLAFAVLGLGDQETARSLFQEGLGIFRRLGDRWRIAWGLDHLGQVAHSRGDLETARSLYQESLAMSRALGNIWTIATSLGNLGHLACDQRADSAAAQLLEESLSLWRELGNKRLVAHTLYMLGKVARFQNDCGAAHSRYEEGLAVYEELGHQQGAARCREGLAEIAGRPGKPGMA